MNTPDKTKPCPATLSPETDVPPHKARLRHCQRELGHAGNHAEGGLCWEQDDPAARSTGELRGYVSEGADPELGTCFLCSQFRSQYEVTFRGYDRTVTLGICQPCAGRNGAA